MEKIKIVTDGSCHICLRTKTLLKRAVGRNKEYIEFMDVNTLSDDIKNETWHIITSTGNLYGGKAAKKVSRYFKFPYSILGFTIRCMPENLLTFGIKVLEKRRKKQERDRRPER